MPHYHVFQDAGNDRRVIAATETFEEAREEVRGRFGSDVADRFEGAGTTTITPEIDERIVIEFFPESCGLPACRLSQ